MKFLDAQHKNKIKGKKQPNQVTTESDSDDNHNHSDYTYVSFESRKGCIIDVQIKIVG